MRRLFAFGSLCLLLAGLPGAAGIAQSQAPSLLTRWAADVTPDNVLPDYPRPQLVRERWLNLNGAWDYALTGRAGTRPETFDGTILVPFPAESTLSGLNLYLDWGRRLWYRRTFEVPADWSGEQVLLHFGAVDWETMVWVNGVELGVHRGGYDPFSFDISDTLLDEGPQEVVVAVWDPSDAGLQPRGKQVQFPEGIWYTPSTGIWQTVWLEPVPVAHIGGLRLTPDVDAGLLHLETTINGTIDAAQIRAVAFDGEQIVAEVTGEAGQPFDLPIPDARLWSPGSPFLYDLRVTLLQGETVVDEVASYFGMRKIEIVPDADGVPRFFLNNTPIFNFGLLDQGFWPDGLYTAPTDEALRYDIEVTLQLGFNTIRKHVKVEPERWYYWADRLGVLVWQDMPSGDAMLGAVDGGLTRSELSAEQFESELAQLVETHYNHPSIIMWVLFNEGWGQYDTARLAGWLAATDPTRLVNSASGWNDVGAGDVYDIHSYPGPDVPPASSDRAAVLGEFGGLGLPLEDHLWRENLAWGYRAYEDVAALTEAYAGLIAQLDGLVETRGLAAAIYTQTTDVESEVNGMLTYDRAVIKMGVEPVAEINSRLYSPSQP